MLHVGYFSLLWWLRKSGHVRLISKLSGVEPQSLVVVVQCTFLPLFDYSLQRCHGGWTKEILEVGSEIGSCDRGDSDERKKMSPGSFARQLKSLLNPATPNSKPHYPCHRRRQRWWWRLSAKGGRRWIHTPAVHLRAKKWHGAAHA
jgi:hypothetical protein